MKTVYSPRHAGHSGQVELAEGVIVPAFEAPERAEMIRARVEAAGLGPILAADPHPLDTARRIHDPGYVTFLGRAWDLWASEGRTGTALPMAWPTGGLRADVPPRQIDGLLGFYSFDGGAGFVAGTWDAIRASQDTALTAAALVAGGERAAFALCRPPGHHAGLRTMGGYCYLNNGAIAAQWFLDAGAARVAVLDIDYHHGNGTQELFYNRSDVLVVNIHADPAAEYPYFLGHADEAEAGAGAGFNLNLPMAAGAGFEAWSAALATACAAVARFAPDVLVVSLGVDTFAGDPISAFRLQTADFPRIGASLATLGLPTLFVMEGGYAVAEIGINAVGVLQGFDGG